MAIDPQEIAEENTQRSALARKGSPTEFAEDPKLSTQLAGGGTQAVLEVIKKFQDVANKPPTPQERVLKPDDGTFSDLEAKKEAAPNVLSPEGQAEFKRRNFQAEEPENVQVLQEAEDAIAAEQNALQQSAVDVQAQAQRSLAADARGADPQQALVDEARADQALKMIETREAGIKSLTDDGDFNFDYMDTGDDVNATITALAEIYKDETQIVKRGQAKNQLTIDRAAERMQDEIGFTKTLLSRRDGASWNAEEFVAARELLVRSSKKLNDLASKIQNGQGTDLDRLAFRRQMAIHAGIQLQLKGAQTEAARALQSFQIRIGGEDSAVRQAQEARRMLQESGGVELVDVMAKRFLKVNQEQGITGVNTMARGGWRSRTRQMISEAYLAGLLSSPATQVKNILGTGSFMAYQLPAEAIAGVYGAIGRQTKLFLYPNVELSPEQVYLDDFLVRFKGYMDSFKDALRVGAYAFKTEMPAGASKLDVEQYSAITGQTDSYLGKAFDEFGKRARIPFRTLLAGDEFFKTMSQRGELYVQANRAYKAAIRSGKTPQQAQDEAGMMLLDPYSRADDLIDKSKYDTLQSDLGKFGDAAKLIQNADIAGIPVGRFVLPFTVAPTNDAIRTAEFIPILNLVTPNGYADIVGQNGAKAQQLAMGRLTLGSMTAATVASYAIDGRITGATPRDPKVREALPKGWQPWSMVFKGEDWPVDENGNDLPLYDFYGNPNGNLQYVSYNGFGPLAAVIGLTADTMQRMHVTRDPTMRANFAAAAPAAIASYYKELPMLEGISNLADIFEMRGDKLKIDLNNLFKSPAEAATIAGVPNPFSSLQRAGGRIVSGQGVTDPREDIVYFTEADILQQNADGSYVYADQFGEPDYRMIGLPKTGTQVIMRFIKEMDAYQAKNSVFRSDKDKSAPRYDTLGRQLGNVDMNIYARPGRAIFSNLSGFRLSETEPVSDWEKELMRIATTTGGWPLTNPDTKGELRLSNGTISDWINESKNVVMLRKPGLGRVTFKEALESMILDTSNRYGREYDRSDDLGKRALIRLLNKEFLDAGWEELMKRPEYDNIAQTLYDLELAKEERLR